MHNLPLPHRSLPNFGNLMSFKLLLPIVTCFFLSSCGVINGLLGTAGRTVKSVGRTIGLNTVATEGLVSPEQPSFKVVPDAPANAPHLLQR